MNFPDTELFSGDIADFERMHFGGESSAFRSEFGDLDLVFGGPPCQGFSQIGPRDPLDPRNELYLHLLGIAYATKPKFILIENVPNMFSMKGGIFKDRILNSIKDIGYTNIAFRILNSSDFGVPQSRKRIFIIASSDVKYSLDRAFDEAISSLKRKIVTVDEAISDLPKEIVHSGDTMAYPPAWIPTDFQKDMRLDYDGLHYSSFDKISNYLNHLRMDGFKLHNHHTKEIREKRLELIKLLAPGAKANSLPKEIWDNARPEKWRRLHGGQVSHTLLAQMHRDMSEWIHPHIDRWITVREAMRIQSFNDSFVLETSEWQMLKQIGNAVPPLLGLVPAMALQQALAMESGLDHAFDLKGQLSLF